MKDCNIQIQLEQIANQIEREMCAETDHERILNLMDAKEYLRRAWHSIDGSAYVANDTQSEICLYRNKSGVQS